MLVRRFIQVSGVIKGNKVNKLNFKSSRKNKFFEGDHLKYTLVKLGGSVISVNDINHLILSNFQRLFGKLMVFFQHNNWY